MFKIDKYNKQVNYFKKADERQNPHKPVTERREQVKRLKKDHGLMKRLIMDASHAMQEQIGLQYRVYCLSAKGDLPLVWAHYADCHRGVCLEFSTDNSFFALHIKLNT